MSTNLETVEAQMKVVELRRQKVKLERLKQLKQSNGIRFYRPHWKQHLFHSTNKTGRYLRTGNRFGKSDCGDAEDVAFALGGRLWYREQFDVIDGEGEVRETHPGGFNHPLVTQGIPQRPVKILLLVVDWDKAQEIHTNNEGSYETWGKLFKLIPSDALGKVHKNRGGRIDQIQVKRPREFGGGESIIRIDTVESYKHNRMGAESSDWDVIHVDEPCPGKMFKAHARGLMDRNGSYWFTCTPVDEMWINDLFTPNRMTMVRDAHDGLEVGSTKHIITGSIFDNPYRSDAGVAEFESTLTKEEIQCRLYGLPLALAGIIYKEFIYDMHALCEVPVGWKSYTEPPADYTIRVAWDVHQRLPQAVLLAATAPTGQTFLYDEIFSKPIIGDTVKILREKLKGRYVADYIIDPFSVVPDPLTGSCVLDELAKEGFYFRKASKDLSLGISKVKEFLSARGHNGLPLVYVAPICSETLFEFTHYVWDGDKNKPKDQDDHMLENFYRLVLSGLDYVKPLSEEDVVESRPLRVGHSEDLEDFAIPDLFHD